MFSATYVDHDNDDKWQVHCPNATSGVWLFPGIGCLQRVVQMGCHLEKLKYRAINNALGKIDVPITNVQIQSQTSILLTDAGFSCVTD